MTTDGANRNGEAVVVFGAGTNQLPVIAAARRLGLRAIAIDRDANTPGRAIADRFLGLDLEAERDIDRALRGEVIRGVVARVTAPGALESARRLALARGLPTPEPALVAASTHKRALAACLDGTSLRSPERITDPTPRDLESGPILIRPDVTRRGKAGIRRVHRAEQIAPALEEARSCSANGGVDVARFVEGADLSVLAQLDRGRAWPIAAWDEWVGLEDDGRILGLGVGMPSRLDLHDARIRDALDTLARRFDESRGLVMLSLRIDRSGVPWLIEIHLGLGGDAIAEQLLPTALPGFDPFAAWVTAQIGGRVATPGARPRPCAVVRETRGATWRPMTARTPRELRARLRVGVPKHIALPDGLRNDEGPARASGTDGPRSWSARVPST